jgi:hypothetical protein
VALFFVGLSSAPPPAARTPLTDLAPTVRRPVMPPSVDFGATPAPTPDWVVMPLEMPNPEAPPHGTAPLTTIAAPTPPDPFQPPPAAVNPERRADP